MSSTDWDLLSSYAGLLALACGSIYVGSYGSLPNVKTPGASGQEGEDDDEDEDKERMTSDDAWLFPVIGSVALFGLYIIVKYFGTEWINRLLGYYFSVTGAGSVWKSLISLGKFLIGSKRWKAFDRSRLLLKKGKKEIVNITWRTPSLILLPLGVLPSILYTFSTSTRKSVLITDILSLSFSHNALSLLKLDSFKTGCVLLSGLFLYDIWWVFGTEVMVKVATSLDIPIKLLWPKSLVFSSSRGFTMLGLGDIVIPGTFVALALRYDYYRFKQSPKSTFVKPYFYAALTAYLVGLATTMSVMHIFGAAQPALLYLSPACMLSFFITAAVRGQLKEAWNWSDEAENANKSVGAKVNEIQGSQDQNGSVDKVDEGNTENNIK